MGRKKNTVTKFLAGKRRWIQGVLGLGTFALMSVVGVSLWWILAVGAFAGVVFGKVFCRWACPIGFIMEIITGAGGKDSKFQQMYQYHKLGCPIAWASGALNKFSFFKVKLNTSTCSGCLACDEACYLSVLDPAKYSLVAEDKQSSATAFSCSRCLACVTACPNGSLSYGPAIFPAKKKE